MRIITGDFKGRRLEMPENNNIRPTTEKVKEAIFSIIAGNLEDAVCVDLFAGTGNLGLEALSRGAEKCYFADNDRESLDLIKSAKRRNGRQLFPGILRRCSPDWAKEERR